MSDFQIPQVGRLHHPEAFVTGILRNFDFASQALGAATDTLQLRLVKTEHGLDPNYQIGTTDGIDAAAFSGTTHELLFDDITERIDENELSREAYTQEHVRAWLDQINGQTGQEEPLFPGMAGEG
ncbi:hypothetical protein L0F51_07195 [Afifella sp. H1R]|uniref:hypothetical protein n=1 Tax=Afifella sp. H1R TaxID=2908841 RepID=UPI001F25C62D|nr:hypothetical protein [Afifella sp. H1R]MCF1503545.1 hypothetical protein [Afifella sp. H1R]